MRWDAFCDCPRPSCDGTIEVWLDSVEEKPKMKAIYLYACTECRLYGNWEMFARQYGGKRRDEEW